MKNQWNQIEITVPGGVVEVAVALLAEQGCQGTIVEERTLDTFVVPEDDLEDDRPYCLKAYFTAAENTETKRLLAALSDSLSAVPVLAPWVHTLKCAERIDNQDWAENWKQNFSGFAVGERLLIKPSWEELTADDSRVVIEIDPGMAFGTGTHGTTRLCLEVIARLFAGPAPPQSTLDVGTGSGILALGAAALGCAQVVGTDIDPEACAVARDNIAKNGYTAQIAITDQPLEDLPQSFDLVVANILAEENIRLKQALLAHLETDGWLVLSGILREKEALVRAAFAELPLAFSSVDYQDDWVCLTYRRN